MSRFDLGDAGDFQRLTMGSAAGVLQTLSLAGRDPSKWDILEASYLSEQSTKDSGGTAQPVLFHVFQSKSEYQAGLSKIADQGGRRKVKYVYPYKDGQTTDDLGRTPETFTVDAIIHGQRYLTGLRALLTELNKPTPGDLIHPVRGRKRVVVESFNISHQSDSRKAAVIQITFTEHSFDLIDFERKINDTSVKNALTKALEFLSKIDGIITNVLGAALFLTSLKNQIVQGLQDYKNRFGTSLTRLNKTFNTSGSVDIPGLLPTQQETLTFPTIISPSDSQATLPIDQTSEELASALAVDAMTKDVIATRAQLSAVIDLLSTGKGSLEFYDDILTLKQSGVDLQNALERGIASSRTRIVDYTVPRLMSLREICFANGIPVERVVEVDQLNPDLLSTNYVAKGTTVRVPTQ